MISKRRCNLISSVSVLADARNRIHSPFRRMNWYIYAINVLSSIILLSTYSFLTFLWFSSDENTTWRKIANQDWITQATTLSSALIRLATGIQATTASCMLASLAIEKGKVPLRELANMSVMRFNSSPLALCWLLLHNVFARGCMVRKVMHPVLAALLFYRALLFNLRQQSWLRTSAQDLSWGKRSTM
jgi:hypothetical protein